MARFTNGWVKLYRSAWEGDIGDNLVLWALWNALLSMATYLPTKKIFNGEQRELPPGTIIFGLREFAEKWEVSKPTISRWLKYLEKTERIKVESVTRGTLVTICNWETYQSKEDDDVTPSLHEVYTKLPPSLRQVYTDFTPSLHEVALTEESKKEEGKKEERRKKKKSSLVGIRVDYPKEFCDIWDSYECKGDKKESFEVWKTLGLSEDESVDLTKAVKNYVLSKPEYKFRKDFQRFLKTDWRPLASDPLRITNGNGFHQKTKEQLIRENNDRVFAKALAEIESEEAMKGEVQ